MVGLDDDPVGFVRAGDGSVRISRGGRVVVVVGAGQAGRLLKRLDAAATSEAQQQLLAHATGNDRRGNERRGRA
ncbi:hypothetical protein [Deinococcus sp.]|uniref:hypothetical protein n=1 Tax=Deinococcus sp. TaxID=47478 RepID=UPI003CC65406